MPQRHDAAGDRAAATAVILAPQGLEHVVLRRVGSRFPGRLVVVHDPMMAMSELAAARATLPPGRVAFVFAQPESGSLRRDVLEAVERHMPGVHAIAFDEPGLRRAGLLWSNGVAHDLFRLGGPRRTSEDEPNDGRADDEARSDDEAPRSAVSESGAASSSLRNSPWPSVVRPAVRASTTTREEIDMLLAPMEERMRA